MPAARHTGRGSACPCRGRPGEHCRGAAVIAARLGQQRPAGSQGGSGRGRPGRAGPARTPRPASPLPRPARRGQCLHPDGRDVGRPQPDSLGRDDPHRIVGQRQGVLRRARRPAVAGPVPWPAPAAASRSAAPQVIIQHQPQFLLGGAVQPAAMSRSPATSTASRRISGSSSAAWGAARSASPVQAPVNQSRCASAQGRITQARIVMSVSQLQRGAQPPPGVTVPAPAHRRLAGVRQAASYLQRLLAEWDASIGSSAAACPAGLLTQIQQGSDPVDGQRQAIVVGDRGVLGCGRATVEPAPVHCGRPERLSGPAQQEHRPGGLGRPVGQAGNCALQLGGPRLVLVRIQQQPAKLASPPPRARPRSGHYR